MWVNEGHMTLKGDATVKSVNHTLLLRLIPELKLAKNENFLFWSNLEMIFLRRTPFV